MFFSTQYLNSLQNFIFSLKDTAIKHIYGLNRLTDNLMKSRLKPPKKEAVETKRNILEFSLVLFVLFFLTMIATISVLYFRIDRSQSNQSNHSSNQ